MAGHFRSTRERFGGVDGPMLVLHDTTQLSYRRDNIGLLHQPKHGPTDRWRKEHPLCGISLHSSLVITPAGLPLGLAAVKFWTRQEFKGTNALKRKINPTRVPIEQKESLRWLLNLQHATALLGERRPLCPYWRPRKRHLRTVLHGPRRRHSFPSALVCQPPRWGWHHPDRSGNGRGARKREAAGRSA